jgi:hypothetical protein
MITIGKVCESHRVIPIAAIRLTEGIRLTKFNTNSGILDTRTFFEGKVAYDGGIGSYGQRFMALQDTIELRTTPTYLAHRQKDLPPQ